MNVSQKRSRNWYLQRTILTSLKHRLLRKGLLSGKLKRLSSKAFFTILSSVIAPQVQVQASWRERWCRRQSDGEKKKSVEIDNDTWRSLSLRLQNLREKNSTAVHQNFYICMNACAATWEYYFSSFLFSNAPLNLPPPSWWNTAVL